MKNKNSLALTDKKQKKKKKKKEETKEEKYLKNVQYKNTTPIINSSR